jgi:hypothetical protein
VLTVSRVLMMMVMMMMMMLLLRYEVLWEASPVVVFVNRLSAFIFATEHSIAACTYVSCISVSEKPLFASPCQRFPSVLGSHRTFFFFIVKRDAVDFYENSTQKLQVWLKSDKKNTGHFTGRRVFHIVSDDTCCVPMTKLLVFITLLTATYVVQQ